MLLLLLQLVCSLMVLGFNQQDLRNDSKSQLCIPEDNMEDLEFFPNFSDNLIQLPTDEHYAFNSFYNTDCGDDFWNFLDLLPEPVVSQDSLHGGQRAVLEEHEGDPRPEPEPLVSQDSSKGKSADPEPEPKVSKDYFEPKPEPEPLVSQLPIKGIIRVVSHGSLEGKRRRKSVPESFSLKRRRCSHCEAEKTPQWRMGPDGSKSLCNACGVRYKSGRLVPEYRPAASPSFDSSKHSNFHKKIIKKKSLGYLVIDDQ
ncbi:hypothetical protein OROHE_017150 [Orobanche hederae]